jgi:hypothetical protein
VRVTVLMYCAVTDAMMAPWMRAAMGGAGGGNAASTATATGLSLQRVCTALYTY